MKNRILYIVLLFSSLINSIAQFTEVPTPTNTALYSGCTSIGPSNYAYIWVCGAGGKVYKGRNNPLSLTWLNVSGNLPANAELVTIAAIDTMIAFTGANISTTAYIYKTTNSGTNWVQQFSQPNGHINTVWMRNALTGFAYGNPVGGRWSLWRTTNGGSTWDSTGRYLPASGNETGYNNSMWCVGDTIIFGTNNTRTYFSSNHGASWQIQSTGTETNIFSIYWDFYLPSRLFAGSTSSFMNSSNFGSNWLIQQNVPGTGNIMGICSYTPGVYGITETIHLYIRSNKIYSGQYFSGNWAQFYTSPAGNYTFMFQKRNEPPPAIQGMGSMVAVRDNGGVSICFTCRWGGIRKLGNKIPTSFSISQNYPNPFNPTTKIKFQIPARSAGGAKLSNAKLIVYDILGREVQTLVNEQLTPGTYEVDFEGTNLSSGVYYYTFSAGDFVETKRMVLIK
ncbi:MAG TPA: T9SS type A sorting domain-containing protein [Ignavibacteria bacterium]|jgi:hypothetical protein